MGMKDKGGRAFSTGNELMGAMPYNKLPYKPVGAAPLSKARRDSRRASNTVTVQGVKGQQFEPMVNDPFAKGNFLMGW